MSKSEDRIGKAGQNRAAEALRSIGVLLVEKIATPTRLIPSRYPYLYRVIFEEPVSGDHRGVTIDGISVLAETKTIRDRNLRWSDFKEGQPERLSAHAQYAISLLVWVHQSGIYILRWPVPGFAPGYGLTVERADKLAVGKI